FPILVLASGRGVREGLRASIPYAVLLVVTGILYAAYSRALTGAATANYRVGFIFEEFDVLRFADTAYKTVFEVFPIMLGPVLLIFLGIGLLQSIAEQRALRPAAVVLYFAGVQWFVSLFVLSPAPRYLMAPIIVLSLWSAAGIAHSSVTLQGIGA